MRRDSLVHGAHTFTLTATPDGTARVANTEAFSGWLLRPFEGVFKQGKHSTGGGYGLFNKALERRVEGVAHPAGNLRSTRHGDMATNLTTAEPGLSHQVLATERGAIHCLACKV